MIPEKPPKLGEFWLAFGKRLEVAWSRDEVRTAYADREKWSLCILDLLEAMGKGEDGFGYRGIDGARGVTREHYRVDQCWFSYTGTTQDDTWHLDVAIEHENEGNGYRDEVRKLMAIRCPLRVVIGYPETSEPHHHPLESDTVTRRHLDTTLDKSRYPHEGDFLLILGHRSRWRKWRWHAYSLLTRARWSPIALLALPDP